MDQVFLDWFMFGEVDDAVVTHPSTFASSSFLRRGIAPLAPMTGDLEVADRNDFRDCTGDSSAYLRVFRQSYMWRAIQKQ